MKTIYSTTNSFKNSIDLFRFPKKALFSSILIVFFTLVGYAQQPAPYITIWKTDNPGISSDNQITIPASGDFNYTWQEVGNTSHAGSGSGTDETTIDFGSIGTYQVSITPTGTDPFHSIRMNNSGDKEKILKVIQWGNIAWSSFGYAYYEASNLEITATDIPDLSTVTIMTSAFAQTAISTVPNMNDWNTQNVTKMTGMFWGASSFNEDIGNWNTANVEFMDYMFLEATSFNQDIGRWNTVNVTYMEGMFKEASSFNQDLVAWNTQNVSNMKEMFKGASSFNRNIGSWNTQNVSDMKEMFKGASSFNQNIGGWDTQNVTDMKEMFMGATSFNQNMDGWNTHNVTTMVNMFNEASSFNGNIGSWNTQSVTDMLGMFKDATSFNQDIGGWSTENVIGMSSMFAFASSFNQYIGGWNTQNVARMSGMFREATSFNQNLGAWDLSSLSSGRIMLGFSGMDCENYSRTLRGWANNTNTSAGIILDAYGMEFSPDIESYRNTLIDDLVWDVRGDSQGSCALSTNSEVNITLDIYPNPTRDLLYINGLSGSETIMIFDLNGRLLYSFIANAQEESIDLSGFASGIYFLDIESENQVRTTKKIIKE